MQLILNSTVCELLVYMNKGELTSEEILVTYYKRVGTIGRELNLIGETQFEEALKKARKCDETRKNT